jgi:pimeloyl-ACP methyl ester carboxylesterase
MSAMTATKTQYLQRPGGRLAYDVQGSGQLIVAVPGMGDIRSTYRFLVPQLVDAGFRVATLDLRGHGDSDTTFTAHDDVALASDIVALTEHLGAALIIGNSMAAGAAVIAAAERPELVTGLVLVGPFVREHPLPFGVTTLMRLALRRPWGPRVWRAFHRRMFPSHLPADYDTYVGQLMASLTRPGAWTALQQTVRTSHDPAEARIDDVRAPALVVMGTNDPDFKDPTAEAQWVAERLAAPFVLVQDAGHYPHAEFPEQVLPAVVEFAHGVAGA